MANPWKVIIGVGACSLLVSGCASMRHDEEAEQPALQSRDAELSEKDAQLRDMKGMVSSMSTRIEALEARLQTMNDRMEPGTAAKGVTLIQPRAVDHMGERAHLGQEQAQYQEARLLQKSRKFDEAREVYRSFLEQNPDHAWASMALLHIGETFASQNQMPAAKESFERVLKSYDRSPAVPEALTWLKKIAEEEGNDAMVARYQHELALHYPGQGFPAKKSAHTAMSARPAAVEVVPNREAEGEMSREPQSVSVEDPTVGLDAPPTVETENE